jgi:hypothetical protein
VRAIRPLSAAAAFGKRPRNARAHRNANGGTCALWRPTAICPAKGDCAKQRAQRSKSSSTQVCASAMWTRCPPDGQDSVWSCSVATTGMPRRRASAGTSSDRFSRLWTWSSSGWKSSRTASTCLATKGERYDSSKRWKAQLFTSSKTRRPSCCLCVISPCERLGSYSAHSTATSWRAACARHRWKA